MNLRTFITLNLNLLGLTAVSCGPKANPSDVQGLKTASNSSGLAIQGNGLAYVPDNQGNVMPDFSYVGYRQGLEDIPNVPVKATVTPGDGDDGARIQAAIDQVANLPLENGFRGAVLLKKGTYEIAKQIFIKVSGVVLRGEGNRENGTVVIATGTEKRTLVVVQGSGRPTMVPGTRVLITDPYVPFGRRVFQVESTAGLKPGDQIVVQWKNNEKFIQEIGMNKYNWTPFSIDYERTIKSICGNTISIDVPLVQSIDKQYAEGSVFKYTFAGRISNVGIEHIRFISEYKKGMENSDEDHAYSAITIDKAEHGWVRNISAYHFIYAAVEIERDGKNFTVTDSECIDPVSLIDGRRRYSFRIVGSLNLFQNNFARNGRHDFVTGQHVAGPNVFYNSKAIMTHSDSGPHARWATGTLYDNISAGELNVQDRGDSGTNGHGWAGAQQVFWNSKAGSSVCQKPPTAQNFSFGFIGDKNSGRFVSGRPSCAWESQGRRVSIASLYRKQLDDRRAMGAQRYALSATCTDGQLPAVPQVQGSARGGSMKPKTNSIKSNELKPSEKTKPGNKK